MTSLSSFSLSPLPLQVPPDLSHCLCSRGTAAVLVLSALAALPPPPSPSSSHSPSLSLLDSFPDHAPSPFLDLTRQGCICYGSQSRPTCTIAKEAQGKKVVIIGTSFIGMEVGAYLSDKAASVDCIDIAAVPFERVLGERIGKTLQKVKL